MPRAAERVDDQLLSYMQAGAIAGPCPVMERLLVYVNPDALHRRGHAQLCAQAQRHRISVGKPIHPR